MSFFRVSVTVPGQILRQSIVQDSIAMFMRRKSEPELVALFRQTVFGWGHKPSFRKKIDRRAGKISVSVWADGDKRNKNGLEVWKQYALVSRGVEPHRIPKTGTTSMQFFWDGPGSYKASSRPRVIKSGRHSQRGGWVQKWVVNHPGSEARLFDVTIANHYAPTFASDMQDAISVAAHKTLRSNK